jgi:hypothetical protein
VLLFAALAADDAPAVPAVMPPLQQIEVLAARGARLCALVGLPFRPPVALRRRRCRALRPCTRASRRSWRRGAPPDTGAAGGAAHDSGSGPRTAHLGISAGARCSRVSTPAQQASPPRRKSTAAAALATDGAPRSDQACGTDLADGRRLARKHGGSPSPPLYEGLFTSSHSCSSTPKIQNPVRGPSPGPPRQGLLSIREAVGDDEDTRGQGGDSDARCAEICLMRELSRAHTRARTRTHTHAHLSSQARTPRSRQFRLSYSSGPEHAHARRLLPTAVVTGSG